MPYYCSVCKETISKNDYESSTTNIGMALCIRHQRVVTPQAVKLSKALKIQRIEHELEYFDGFKHVDIAILNARMYIELDGSQHAFNPQQTCIDDDRDQYSLRDGFVTKRYPNDYIDKNVEQIAVSIATLANKRRSELLDIKQKNGNKHAYNKSILKRLREKAFIISERLENFE